MTKKEFTDLTGELPEDMFGSDAEEILEEKLFDEPYCDEKRGKWYTPIEQETGSLTPEQAIELAHANVPQDERI